MPEQNAPRAGGAADVDNGTVGKSRQRDRVAGDLARLILAGTYQQGETLPTEAELSAQFQVSRTALREAIRTLAAKGLLSARPRTGTTVAPASSWNQLDRQVLEWRDQIAPDFDFVIGLNEVRRLIEPAAAAFAAERSTAQDLARIEAGFEAMRSALDGDYDAWLNADQRFHLAILDATHNPVFSSLGTIISSSLRNSFQLSSSVAESFIETLDLHGEVLDAIRMREPERASRLTLTLLDQANSDLDRLIEQTRRDASSVKAEP